MNLNHYQSEAQQTDRVPTTSQASVELGVIVPLLGLAGEAGELLSAYKKFLRDGPAHRLFKERVAEELGDILWYVANVATKFGLLGFSGSLLREVKQHGVKVTCLLPGI
ncbi:MAG: MazG nucleotide pyrophosphohydrolase domain-containing protein, partial [Hyphomicrobium sp.]